MKRNFTGARLAKELEKAGERLVGCLLHMHEADADDPGCSASVTNFQMTVAAIRDRRSTLREDSEQLSASGRGQASLTDPDARSVKARKGPAVCSNVPIEKDAKHNLIAAQQVHGHVTDIGENGSRCPRQFHSRTDRHRSRQGLA